MSYVEPAMRTYLAGANTTADNFYLQKATQEPGKPYGVVFKVSPGKDYTHDGSGLSQSRMQCSCFGDTYYDSKVLAGEVITAMEAWPNSEANVQAVFLAGESDLKDDLFHVALDFWVWHKY